MARILTGQYRIKHSTDITIAAQLWSSIMASVLINDAAILNGKNSVL